MFLRKLNLIIKGFCIGSADVIPGVSGSTIAFILGIYPRLINAIKSFDGKWLSMIFSLNFRSGLQRPDFNFLIPLGVGILSAVFFFTRIIPLPLLVRTHSEIIYGLFFGLVLGSIILFLYKLGTNLISKYFIFLLFGIFFGVYFISLVPSSTPDDSWFIFICGIVSISAMLLPGVSGSFILLMMKKYAYILNAIGHIEFSIITPFIFGVITGLIVFSRLISYILEYFYQQTILFMTGLLIASLYVIWPFQNRFYEIIQNKEIMISSRPQIPELLSEQVLYSITMMIFGLLIVIILSRFSRESVRI
jgi:putative membrane protein